MGDINEDNIEEAYKHMRDKNLLNTSYTLGELKGIQDLKGLNFTEKEYFILYCLILLNNNRDTCTDITLKIIQKYASNSRASITVNLQLINIINNLYENLCNPLSSNRRGGFYKQRVIKVIRKY